MIELLGLIPDRDFLEVFQVENRVLLSLLGFPEGLEPGGAGTENRYVEDGVFAGLPAPEGVVAIQEEVGVFLDIGVETSGVGSPLIVSSRSL